MSNKKYRIICCSRYCRAHLDQKEIHSVLEGKYVAVIPDKNECFLWSFNLKCRNTELAQNIASSVDIMVKIQ